MSAPNPSSGSEITDIAAQIERAAKQMELRDPDEGLSFADRLINRIVEIAGVSALVAIVGIVFINASCRYLIGFSFAWAEEMVQMIIPWLAMTGVFLAVRRGTMIRIDFFFEKMPARYQGIAAKLGCAFNISVLLAMAWVSLDFVRLFGSDVALYVQIPMGWSTSALVFGALGAAMAYMAEFYREWNIRSGPNGTGETL